MKSIVITIQVPDGANVEVNGAGSVAAATAPPHPDGLCPIHDAPWKLVPAGFSQRTNKSYNAFYACSVRGCDQRPGDVPVEVPADWG